MTRTLGRPLDIPLVDPADIKQYFGEKKKKSLRRKYPEGFQLRVPASVVFTRGRA